MLVERMQLVYGTAHLSKHLLEFGPKVEAFGKDGGVYATIHVADRKHN